MYTLIPTVYRALLKSAVSGTDHRIHTTKERVWPCREMKRVFDQRYSETVLSGTGARQPCVHRKASTMARKKIREYNSKQLLKAHLARLLGIELSLQVAQVTQSTNFTDLIDQNRWLTTSKLVVKPDMLFGKRGKHDLVGLNLSVAEVEAFIKARMGKHVEIDGCAGAVTTFIVEPFVPHDQEYYLSITSQRMNNQISFSEHGKVSL